ncbi:MAG: hypothetical protein ACI8RD_009408 [Bacillariaceae sp.]|jgi:hypothetical protein
MVDASSNGCRFDKGQTSVSILDENWNKKFDQVKEYYNEKFKCIYIPNKPENRTLCNWLNKQRCRRSKLSLVRKEKLDSINFMIKGKFEIEWMTRYNELKSYVARTGGKVQFPVANLDKDTLSLSYWVFLQKSHMREKTISPHRMELLQQIGVVDYETKKVVLNHSLNDKKWSIMFQELLKYKEQYGDCLVPVRYTDDSKKPALGRWINKQRIRHRKNHIGYQNENDYRINKLNEVGFQWSLHK